MDTWGVGLKASTENGGGAANLVPISTVPSSRQATLLGGGFEDKALRGSGCRSHLLEPLCCADALSAKVLVGTNIIGLLMLCLMVKDIW